MSSDEDFINGGQHCHVDNSEAEKKANKKAIRQLLIATFLCLVFMVVEIVGGIVANSLAIATDAAHLLSDLASFCISLTAVGLATRPPTMRMSYGWYRAEVLGAMASVFLIWLVTLVLVYLAILRILHPDYSINASVMMITAALSVAFNLLMMLALQGGHGHSHGGGSSTSHSHGDHSHSHSHGKDSSDENSHDKDDAKANSMSYRKLSNDYGSITGVTDSHDLEGGHMERPIASKESTRSTNQHKDEKENINVRAAFIHVIGDLIQSFGVLIASYVVYYKPEWKIVDPVCTLIFSLLVILTTTRIIGDVFRVLMEASPTDISFKEVKSTLSLIDGVIEVHDLHIWSLTTARTALSAHLAIKKDANGQAVVAAADQILKQKFGIFKSTIQVENYIIEMDNCSSCKGPKD